MPTIGNLFTEARTILQDADAIRYSDAELMEAFNGALREARAKRPDAFLGIGLRVPVPTYSTPGDLGTAFPLDLSVWAPVLYYVVGRTELRDDTFSENSRAVTLMNKFASQLLQALA